MAFAIKHVLFSFQEINNVKIGCELKINWMNLLNYVDHTEIIGTCLQF